MTPNAQSIPAVHDRSGRLLAVPTEAPAGVLTHTRASACPRCAAQESTNYGARCSCRSCGATWQAA